MSRIVGDLHFSLAVKHTVLSPRTSEMMNKPKKKKSAKINKNSK